MQLASPNHAPVWSSVSNQERRHERVRDVRREIHLQAVQPEAPSGRHAEEQMKSVERRAADEDAEANRRGFSCRPGAFGPQLPEPTRRRRDVTRQSALSAASTKRDAACGNDPAIRRHFPFYLVETAEPAGHARARLEVGAGTGGGGKLERPEACNPQLQRGAGSPSRGAAAASPPTCASISTRITAGTIGCPGK